MKFEHIGIKVMDMEQSIDFYTTVLGCTVEKDVMNGASRLVFLNAHGMTIELIYKTENQVRETGPVEHLAFRVDDLKEAVRKLNAHGIMDITKPIVFNNSDIIFFNGPNNERFEFAAYQK